MTWNKNYRVKGFSTVEGIVGGVLISIVMLLTYSTIAKTIDQMNSITILRGIAKYDSWKNDLENNFSSEPDVLPFEGGKTKITFQQHPSLAGLLEVQISIIKGEDQTVYSFTELMIAP